MIPRSAQKTLRRFARGYPIVVITGPRQSGKTTLARMTFEKKAYVSLENPDERAFANADPKGFLARFPEGAVIDEAQNCTELFSYVQSIVDEKRKTGLFVLTGSQNFGLLARITQSLAGRAGVVHLLPFSMAELRKEGLLGELDDVLYRGLYPPLYDRKLAAEDWYANYVMTYLERDVRQIANVLDLHTFQRFLKLCAARTAQLLNISNLALECGVSQGTTRAWLSVLEASYIVHLLQPHHRNFGKRVVKTPKLYFCDTGLACSLLSIQDSAHAAIHPQRAALFETLIVGEMLKRRLNEGLRSNLYFWRDNIGTEIDVVVEEGHQLVPVEIKSGQTVTADFAAPLNRWLKYAGTGAKNPTIVYGGSGRYVRSRVTFVPWYQAEI